MSNLDHLLIPGTQVFHAGQVQEAIEQLTKQAKQAETLRSALVGLVGADSEDELRQMEAFLLTLPDSEENKKPTLNAVRALLETI